MRTKFEGKEPQTRDRLMRLQGFNWRVTIATISDELDGDDSDLLTSYWFRAEPHQSSIQSIAGNLRSEYPPQWELVDLRGVTPLPTRQEAKMAASLVTEPDENAFLWMERIEQGMLIIKTHHTNPVVLSKGHRPDCATLGQAIRDGWLEWSGKMNINGFHRNGMKLLLAQKAKLFLGKLEGLAVMPG